MINVFRSQWILLSRARMWAMAGVATAAFAVVATALTISTAEPAAVSRGGDGLTIEALTGPGGATTSVIWGLAFGSILLLASFISATGNEFSRGTFRSALLRQSGRVSFIAGKLAALLTVTAILMVGALAVGWLTAAIVAPGQDLDTAGWFGLDAFGEAGGDLLRLFGWAVGWAVLGTTIAAVFRSTPVALGVGILWFGPIENVIGEGQDFAARWFPGQLLRALVAPGSPDVVSTSTAVTTLAIYMAACAAVLTFVLTRRDVTS
jgi:hypothetical protein